jgi:hypothetical protein
MADGSERVLTRSRTAPCRPLRASRPWPPMRSLARGRSVGVARVTGE